MKNHLSQILSLLFLLVPLTLVPASSKAAIISLYQFDNTTTDTVRGAAATASVSGTTSYVAGVVGQAFNFNGSTFLNAPQAGAGLTAFSISSWVLFETRTDWATIVKNWGSTVPGAFHFGLNEGTLKISNFLGTSTGNPAVLSDTLTTNAWYHAAITFGPSGTQKLYINGSQVDSTAASGTINNNFPRMSMGAKLNDTQNGVGSPAGWLDGYMDELTFFNTELSSTQVSGIYNAGLAGQSVTTLGYAFEPYVDPLAAVPEPGTWAAAALLAAGAAFARWRKRVKVA